MSFGPVWIEYQAHRSCVDSVHQYDESCYSRFMICRQGDLHLNLPSSRCNVSRVGESLSGAVQGSVGQPWTAVEPEVDKHGACVLTEEHCGPTYLQSTVLAM